MTTYENLISKIQEVAKEVKDQPETPKMIPFIEKMIDISNDYVQNYKQFSNKEGKGLCQLIYITYNLIIGARLDIDKTKDFLRVLSRRDG